MKRINGNTPRGEGSIHSRNCGFLLIAVMLTLYAPLSVMADEDESRRFGSRERLVQTALQDEAREVSRAELQRDESKESLQAAEASLAEAEASGDADAIAAAILERDAARERYERAETRLAEATAAQQRESIRVLDAVDRLSDEQVLSLDRSLNNARHNPFGVNLDAEHLESVAEGDYSRQQINALTKALEEEAKFTHHAERFEEKYEASGDARYLEKAERFESRSEEQKQRFLSKIDRYEDREKTFAVEAAEESEYQEPGPAQETATVEPVRSEERDRVLRNDRERNMSRASAEKAVYREMKQESRSAARDSARQAARNAARETAREAAREERRNAARGKVKAREK